MHRVEVVVVARQRGDVHQTLHIDVGQLDEDAEAGHRGDHAGEGLAYPLAHVFALQPVDHVAGRLVGAPLGHRALLAKLLQARLVVGIDARLRHARRADALDMLGLPLGADQAADRAVHQQVRIAADRRGEVGVGLVVQAEVAVVLRGVHRLAEGTQHHRLDQLEVRTALDLLQQRLVVRRGRFALAAVQGQAEFAEELAQVVQLFLRRAVVDPVQRGNLVLLEELGGGDVGRQHAFLDQLVRVVALGRADFRDLAVGAEDDARLLGLEIDRPAAMPRRQQHLVQRIERVQMRHHVRQLLLQMLGTGAVRRLQVLADLGVGEPRVGVDHRLVELVAGQLAGPGQAHLADHGEPVDQWVQRTEAVGENFRQHRDDPLGEVHRVAAPGRFLVQRRADLHIVRDVGDGDIQLPAATLAFLGEYRVVEVAGVLAIDGDERQGAQVDALLLVLLRHFRLEPGRLLLHALRPDVRNVVAAQRDFDLHARRHVVAEHLDHLALGLAVHARPDVDAHLDELVVLGLAALARRDQHFLLDLRIVGDHRADAALLEVAADDDLMGALDHFHQRAFAAAAAVEAGYPCQRAVAVEHQAHLRRAEEQVIAAVVRDEEAEAVAMAGDAAADQVELVHRRVGAAAGIDKLAVALHGAQAAAQCLFRLLAVQAELFYQLRPGGGRAAFGEMRQDQFAAGNGVFVFFRLAGGLGVEVLPIGHQGEITFSFISKVVIYLLKREIRSSVSFAPE
ncbi:hypothetical protein D9M70_400460 [compost metagenome]